MTSHFWGSGCGSWSMLQDVARSEILYDLNGGLVWLCTMCKTFQNYAVVNCRMTMDKRTAFCSRGEQLGHWCNLHHPWDRRVTKAEYQENGAEVFSRLLWCSDWFGDSALMQVCFPQRAFCRSTGNLPYLFAYVMQTQQTFSILSVRTWSALTNAICEFCQIGSGRTCVIHVSCLWL